jgi:hypothetical protein
MTSRPDSTISAFHPTSATPAVAPRWSVAEGEVAALLRRLDATGLALRTADPGKVVSVYSSSPEVTTAVTELARSGRRVLPQLDWTLEFGPGETVLILTGPEDALAALGLAEPPYVAEAAGA